MKNIHVLSTDKPSRLFVYDGKLGLAKEFQYGSDAVQNHKIHITNDEEIKKGHWYLTNKNTLCKCIKTDSKYVYSLEGGSNTNCKKIILTTDQDLIKDDVQAIDDEFLEWFVNNPSCEEVKTERLEDGKYVDYLSDGSTFEGVYENYKIIIPKEEPKKHIVVLAGKDAVKEELSTKLHKGEVVDESYPKEFKQETLKEFIGREFQFNSSTAIKDEKYVYLMDKHSFYIAVDNILKWQQEQNKNKYSEEIIDILDNVRYWETCPNSYKVIIERFIEQFKKK